MVPVEVAPPETVVGFSATLTKFAGSMVRLTDIIWLLREPEIAATV
jgi:hypothetical protein